MRSFVLAIIAGAVMMLSGCADGPQPSASAPPAVQTLARPGTLAFSANLAGPSLGIGFACNGPAVGVDCSSLDPALPWGSLPDFTGLADLVKPGRNSFYSADGALHWTAPQPGWAMISAQTFAPDQPFSAEAVLSFHCDSQPCWGGLVPYDGEGEYFAFYFDGTSGKLELHVYGPTVQVPVTNLTYAPDQPLALRLDHDPATKSTKFIVNGQPIWTLTPNEIGPDRTYFTQPWRIAAFWGGSHGTLSRLDVTQGP